MPVEVVEIELVDDDEEEVEQGSLQGSWDVKEEGDEEQANEMIRKGVPELLAKNISRLTSLYSAMDIAQIAKEMEFYTLRSVLKFYLHMC